MPSPQKILSLLLLLFAAIALATPKNKRPKYGWPTVNYQVTSGDPRDTYAIRGNNWNVTEAQLKAGINTPGTVLTGWELKSAINVDDIHTFKAKFRLPIHEKEKTQKKLTKLVEPYPLKVWCHRGPYATSDQ
ncbi:hypothetical protein Q7P35_010814 [Cladosporium inversicolor]